MKSAHRFTSLLLYVLILLTSYSMATPIKKLDRFLQCLEAQNSSDNSISKFFFLPNNSSYYTTIRTGIQNQRFVSPYTPKPLAIITPLHDLHVQQVVKCSRTYGLIVRVRSGGHDYEGLSYTARDPFVVIDMRNLRNVSVDTKNKTAWIQGGALLGEVYYRISEKNKNLAFPAGLCPTVGVGGHLSGGGYGTLLRKYGLAADNIIDARIINSDGVILDRKSMGEDLFWAIRGGGGASFGIILAWKIQLVYVPSIVTVFTLNKTLEENATKLVHNWQHIGYKLDPNLFIRILVTREIRHGRLTVQAGFNSIFLGRVDKLLPLMQEKFPELGLKKEDCIEMSYIESAVYFSDLPKGSSINDLIRKDPYPKTYYKAKSDYVVEPISEVALEGLWKLFYEPEAKEAQLIFVPYGGRMAQISEYEIPFPHRAGNIYEIQHLVYWDKKGNSHAQSYINWIRRLYDYMTPFVSKNPRAAYYNYRDLDLGVNINEGNTSYAQASIWGYKYFKKNFDRLVQVKSKVDPGNFFRDEQSIPPVSWKEKRDDQCMFLVPYNIQATCEGYNVYVRPLLQGEE